MEDIYNSFECDPDVIAAYDELQKINAEHADKKRKSKGIRKLRHRAALKRIKQQDLIPGRWICLRGPQAAPNSAGVYVIYSDGELCYIGQSTNLYSRLRHHNILNNLNGGISIKVKLSKRFGDFAMWELRLISKIKPKFNTKVLT